MRPSNCGPDVIHDPAHTLAIANANERVGGGDIVVIATKDHEQGQKFEIRRILPFHDVTVARDILPGTAVSVANHAL